MICIWAAPILKESVWVVWRQTHIMAFVFEFCDKGSLELSYHAQVSFKQYPLRSQRPKILFRIFLKCLNDLYPAPHWIIKSRLFIVLDVTEAEPNCDNLTRPGTNNQSACYEAFCIHKAV